MPLQSSGIISLSDVAGEFGGSTPHSLSEYYGAASGVPGSGTISLSDFYGKGVTAPEPEPEPGLPARSNTFEGQIYRINYTSSPGFPAATNRDQYYMVRSSGNSQGAVSSGVFTEGFYKMSFVDPNFGYQGIANNGFNRVSVSLQVDPSWDFRDYTTITYGSYGAFGQAVWRINNPVWSSYFPPGGGEVMYLSSFTSLQPLGGLAESSDTAASIGGFTARNFDAGGASMGFEWES